MVTKITIESPLPMIMAFRLLVVLSFFLKRDITNRLCELGISQLKKDESSVNKTICPRGMNRY